MHAGDAHEVQVGADLRRSRSSAAAPTATTECLNSRPPISTTSMRGWSTSSTAIVGLWVTTVAGGRAAACARAARRSCRRRGTRPARRAPCAAAARPIAALPSGATCRRPAKSASAGEAGSAPPWTRCSRPSAASARRSRRIVSSDSRSSGSACWRRPAPAPQALEDELLALLGQHAAPARVS